MDIEGSCEVGFQGCYFMLLLLLFAGLHMKLESPFSKISISRKTLALLPKYQS